MTDNKFPLFKPRQMGRDNNPFRRGLDIDTLAANDCAARRAECLPPSTAGSRSARPAPAGCRVLRRKEATMLTDEQKNQFRKALDWDHRILDLPEQADENGFCKLDEVQEDESTLDAFFARYGTRLHRKTGAPDRELHRSETPFGDLYIWKKVEMEGRPKRGTLFVMDFGASRAVHFHRGLF